MSDDEELSVQLLIDKICDEFETALKASPADNSAESQFDLLSFLVRVPESERSLLAIELILLERHYRDGKRLPADASYFLAKYPRISESINRAFAAGTKTHRATPLQADETLAPSGSLDPSQTIAPTHPPSTERDDTTTESLVGQRVKYFGDYELLDEIARGGMGVVYRAKQSGLNRIVALKMILSGKLAGSDEVIRFKSEAEAAARLDHWGIVPIYEIGEYEDQHYFSMAFIDGESLHEKLQEGPLEPKSAAKLCSKVCEAIQ